MNPSKEIETLHSIVLELLKKDDRYKDSDDILFAKIVSIHYGGIEKTKSITLYDYLIDTLDDKKQVPSYDSVTRARRKVQEHHEETRGKNWFLRKKMQDEVKQIIIDLSN